MNNQIRLLGNTKDIITPSKFYRVWFNEVEAIVYNCSVGNYALFSAGGPVHVEVEILFPFEKVKIRPLSCGIKFYIKGRKVIFDIDEPRKLSFEVDDEIKNPLFLFINPAEKHIPDMNDSSVIFFEPGKVYEAGLIRLKKGETVYIGQDAVVFGSIASDDCDDIKILGRGILDGSRWPREGELKELRMIQLINCKNVFIEGITVLNGPVWHVVPVGCQDVLIHNINIITYTFGGDGIDLVGCKNVEVDNAFIRSRDDCIAIKASNYRGRIEGTSNVEKIRIQNSVFWNADLGNALEIGFETRCDEMKDIAFTNCDIIRCEYEGYMSGATLSIHNGDRAFIHDVKFENIRVEDSRQKLIDVKVLHAQYSIDEERGQVKDITFEGIRIVDGPFPVSIIRGFDANHQVENILVKDLYAYGRKINNFLDAKMVAELCINISFE